MSTKKDTAKKQGAARRKVKADARADLAAKIVAVLEHPALPADLKQDFYEALNEFQNTIDLNQLCYSTQALTHSFELRAEEERGK